MPHGAELLHPAPSANAPMHAPSNATGTLMYVPLSLVEDEGTMASSSSAAVTAPMAISTAAAAGPTTLKAALTALVVKLNNYVI